MASIFHLLAPDLSTGTARQLGQLVPAARSLGWNSTVCSLESSASGKSRLRHFVDVTKWCRQPMRLDPTFTIRLARMLRSCRPDLIHCWGQHRSFSIQLALRLSGCSRVLWSVRSEAEAKGLLTSLPPRKSHTIVTNAAHLASRLSNHQSSNGRVTMIPNSVQPIPAPEVVTPLPTLLGVSRNSIFLVAMSDLRQSKRLRDVVWAFDLLRVIRPETQLIVIGEGRERGPVMAFIQSAASAPGIHWLGFQATPHAVLSQCHVFWQASEDEGCSNSLLEALYVGVPIVASDIPGHREVLRGGDRGTLTPLGDCAEMARRTNLLLQRTDTLPGWREQIAAEHSIAEMASSYCHLYSNLLRTTEIAA